MLVVDDHLLVAEGLALTLSHAAGLDVVGVATSAADALAIAEAQHPDVVLLDFYLPDGTGADTALRLRALLPDVAILIVTASTDDDVLRAAVAASASGFLLKTLAVSQVVAAVRQAAEGEMLISAATLVGLLARSRTIVPERELGPERRRPAREPLTPREQQVLVLMAQGQNNRQIAEKLVLEYSTVRGHVEHILNKLGAHSKLEAVARATAAGLLDQDRPEPRSPRRRHRAPAPPA